MYLPSRRKATVWVAQTAVFNSRSEIRQSTCIREGTFKEQYVKKTGVSKTGALKSIKICREKGTPNNHARPD